MAVKKIVQIGHEALKKVSEPVKDVNEVKGLIQDLKDTLLSEGRTGLTDFTVASDDDDEDL